jgi:hypothetical protein
MDTDVLEASSSFKMSVPIYKSARLHALKSRTFTSPFCCRMPIFGCIRKKNCAKRLLASSCLSVCLSVRPSVRPVCLSVRPSVRPSVCLVSVCPSVLPTIRPAVCLFGVCLSVRPAVCLFGVCLSVRPSVRPSVCLSVRPSVRLSVWRLSLCLSVRPSIRPAVCLFGVCLVSVYLSLCHFACNNSARTEWIFVNFHAENFYSSTRRRSKLGQPFNA